MSALWWFLPVVLAGAFCLTWGVRRYALARSLIDIPGARSSHAVPTPRGGGVAIALGFLIALFYLLKVDLVTLSLFLALGGSGAWIALIGFLDDHGHIPAFWRLLGHCAGAAWALYWLGGFPSINVMGFTVELGWTGHLLAVFYMVWLLNLYNFMDGIDGIAGVEAVTVCVGAAILYTVSGLYEQVVLPLILTCAVAGFLFWNFPPARIFMGDVGSGFLGLVLGILSIQAARVDPLFLWGWAILLGVFIVDATWTLMRRLLRGDRVYDAHRSHAYQHAARRLGGHLPVTLMVGGINLVWLMPLALGVALGYLDGVLGVLLAYLPLLVLAIRFGSGRPESVLTQ